MYKIVLIRHGESAWNKENRFTGWQDVPLSGKGLAEAKAAGELLKKEGYVFDKAYTSVLRRAIKTLWCVLEETDLMWIPVEKSWRLNERHYGALQGLNKAETAAEYGDEQVKIWRRSYATRPPLLTKDDERWPGHESRYASLSPAELPLGECLEDTVARVVPYWREVIAPEVRAGRRLIIAAHGNSLRALVKYLDDVSEKDILELNIPTGVPLVYELDEELKPIRHYYLGDAEAIVAAQAAPRVALGEEGAVAAQVEPVKAVYTVDEGVVGIFAEASAVRAGGVCRRTGRGHEVGFVQGREELLARDRSAFDHEVGHGVLGIGRIEITQDNGAAVVETENKVIAGTFQRCLISREVEVDSAVPGRFEDGLSARFRLIENDVRHIRTP